MKSLLALAVLFAASISHADALCGKPTMNANGFSFGTANGKLAVLVKTSGADAAVINFEDLDTARAAAAQGREICVSCDFTYAASDVLQCTDVGYITAK